MSRELAGSRATYRADTGAGGVHFASVGVEMPVSASLPRGLLGVPHLLRSLLAGSALTPTSSRISTRSDDDGVGLIERVAVNALRLRRIHGRGVHGSLLVLGARRQREMRWVDASTLATEMVDLHAERDRPVLRLPRHPVDTDASSSSAADVDSSISVGVCAPRPQPAVARISALNSAPESDFDGGDLGCH